MILYIHGFGSHGLGVKANLFREYFKKQQTSFIAPTLSTIPNLAIQTLEELIESYDNITLIGSSLGGFYALYLAEKYKIKAVLINPSIYPYRTLAKVMGNLNHYYDLSLYEWNEKHIAMLKKFETTILNQKDIFLLLQKGDETLDYEEAVKKLPHALQRIEEGGNHSFEGIERYFEEIEEFLTKKRS